MRNFLAGLVLATSILAHGFWRAGNKLHHFFGSILVLLTAVLILPTSLFRPKTPSIFRFRPQWKEELVVKGPSGSFILDLTIGVHTAYLPSEQNWRKNGPDWARDLWPVLKIELEVWCKKNNATFVIEEDDDIYVIRQI